MVETIMGEGGIKVIPDYCLKGLRKLCNKKKILLILDEVQSGIGRTGKFFAFEYAKIKPDIVPVAKGIGGGFPIGAVLMNKKVAAGMTFGSHGSTFGGNPLAMSVGNAVLDIIFKKGFLEKVQKNSKYFHSQLHKLQGEFPQIIKEVRGVGLLIGIQLFKDQTNFIKKLMDNKMLTIRASENVVRILPPLTCKKRRIRPGYYNFEESVQNLQMKNFLNISDLKSRELRIIIDEASSRKQKRNGFNKSAPDLDMPFKGKSMAMIFEKPSTRTRMSFDIAIKQLGGSSIILNPDGIHYGKGDESLKDTAKVLTEYVDIVMLRTASHKNLEEFGKYLKIPIINGLSERKSSMSNYVRYFNF